jgi:hypothetical protein
MAGFALLRCGVLGASTCALTTIEDVITTIKRDLAVI